jgi:hypothetical protein
MRESSSYQEVKETLLKSGWQDEDLLFEPAMYSHGRIDRPDIVLLYNLFPLAVVEIKRNLDVLPFIAFNAREQAEALGLPFALVTDKTRTLAINTLSGESQTLVDFPTAKDLWIALGREWNPNDPRLYPPYQQEHRIFSLHQVIAVSRVIDAVMSGKRRVLLAMGVGTGRSWVLFQIAWKLIQSRHYRRMLYLSDRVLLLEQMREIFKPLDQNIFTFSRTSQVKDSARVHMATVSQTRTSETSRSLLSLPSDFYDLIFLESIRFEKSPLHVLEHFSMATRIALDDVESPAIPPDYDPPAFTYTVHDAFETEYAEPPDGYIARRLSEIAEIHLGKKLKDKPQEMSNTNTPLGRYLVTPKNLLADGTIELDTLNVITASNADEQLVLQPNDILLVRFTTGVQYRVALVPENLLGVMIFDDSLIRIRVDGQWADPKAVFTFLRSDSGQRTLRMMALGAVISSCSYIILCSKTRTLGKEDDCI